MPSREEIAEVVRALGNLSDRCLLTGGSSIPFYCTERADEAPRVTRDVDVVLHVHTRGDMNDIEELLRQRGFRNDSSDGAPLCRWVLHGRTLVDIMPLDASVLGFSNPWYAAGWDLAIPVAITESCTWRILSAPYLLAAKTEAYRNRGAQHPQSSHDLEDILRIINGRPSLAAEVASSPQDCRGFLGRFFQELLGLPDLTFIISGHLNGDRSSQARIPMIRQRMPALIPRTSSP